MSSTRETQPVQQIVSSLPTTGEELSLFLGDGASSPTRLKHPDQTSRLDDMYKIALENCLYTDPSSNRYLEGLRIAIGYSGGFDFIDSMRPLRWDGSADMEFPHMRLGPSAATQVLQIADVKSEDRVLELFSGGGYFTFFLAISGPREIVSVDLFTPQMYDLPSTLERANQTIFSKLPAEVKPSFTAPTFIQADCTDLPPLNGGFNKVFLHPPFGRESRQVVDLSEIQAFALWLNSLVSVHQVNKGRFETFSIVPSEWMQALGVISAGASLEQVIATLEKRIHHYRPNGITEDIDFPPEKFNKLQEILRLANSFKINSRRVGINLITTVSELEP